jgi:hypothetical protein
MTIWLRIVRPSIGAAFLAACVLGPAQAETLRLNAHTIYERAVTNNIALSPDGSMLQLRSGEVFQDDGPASGFSYKPNTETLSPGTVIRKQLLIPDPQASEAVLIVGGSSDLKVEVNGNPQKLGTAKPIFGEQWHAYTIDPSALKPGINDIIIRGTGKVKIARARRLLCGISAQERSQRRWGQILECGQTGSCRQHFRRVLRTGLSKALCIQRLYPAAGDGCLQP